jgi:hypothetical protein
MILLIKVVNSLLMKRKLMMGLPIKLDKDLDFFFELVDSHLIQCELLFELSDSMIEGLGLGMQ